MSAEKPWEDVEESPETKRIKEATKRMKQPPKMEGSPKPKPTPLPTDAWGKATELERKRKKLEKLTRPLRKALPGQGE